MAKYTIVAPAPTAEAGASGKRYTIAPPDKVVATDPATLAPAKTQAEIDAEALGPSGTNFAVSGLGQAGGRVVGTLQRAFGYDEAADETFRNVKRIEEASREASPGILPAVGRQVVGGVALAAPAVATTLASGGSIPIAAAAGAGTATLMAGSEAITEAKDAKVTADQLTAYVASQAGIEGVLGGVMGLTGGKAVSGPVADGLKAAMKRMGVNVLGAEAGLAMNLVAGKLTEVKPEDLTYRQIFDMALEAGLTAGATQGGFEGVGAVSRGRARRTEAQKAAAKAALDAEIAAAKKEALDQQQASETIDNTELTWDAKWQNYADTIKNTRTPRLPDLTTDERLQQAWEQVAREQAAEIDPAAPRPASEVPNPRDPSLPPATLPENKLVQLPRALVPPRLEGALADAPVSDVAAQNPVTPRLFPREGMPELPDMVSSPEVGPPRAVPLPDVEAIPVPGRTGPEVLPVGVEPMMAPGRVRGTRMSPTIIPDLPGKPGLLPTDPSSDLPPLAPPPGDLPPKGPNSIPEGKRKFNARRNEKGELVIELAQKDPVPAPSEAPVAPVEATSPPVEPTPVPPAKKPHEMTRDEYDQWRIDELNRLNPQLNGALRLEILSPEDQAARGSNDGAGGTQVGGHSGSTVTRSSDAPSGTTSHEVRHLIDLLLGGKQVTAYIGDIKKRGEAAFQNLKDYLLSGRKGGKFDGRVTNDEETAQFVLDAFYKDREGLRAVQPDIVEFLEQMGADKYAHLQDSHADAAKKSGPTPVQPEIAPPAASQEPVSAVPAPSGRARGTLPVSGAVDEAGWTFKKDTGFTKEIAGQEVRVRSDKDATPEDRFEAVVGTESLGRFSTAAEAKKYAESEMIARLGGDGPSSVTLGPTSGVANLPAVGKALLGLPGAVAKKLGKINRGGYTPEQWQAHIETQPRAKFIESDLGRNLTEMQRILPKDQQVKPSEVYEAMTGDPVAQAKVKASVLSPVVDKARKALDGYSLKLADLLEPYNPRAAGVIRSNEGQWLRRSYRMFDYDFPKIGEWLAEARKKPEWQKASQEVGGDKQLEVLIESMAEDGIDNLAFGAGKSKIPWQSMKQRKDLSPALRAVMGEITDPVEAYAKSTITNATMIARAEFQNKIVETLGKDIYDDRMKAPQGYRQIPDSPGYGPLAGKLVAPEFFDAFTKMSGPVKESHPLVKAYEAWLGFTKAAATTLNIPIGIQKQAVSNVMFSIANGDFEAIPGVSLLAQGKAPMKEVVRHLTQGTSFADTADFSQLNRVMQEKGLWNSHPVAQEIASHGRRAVQGNRRLTQAVDVGQKLGSAASELYQIPDNLVKARGVLSKYDQLAARAKREGWSDKERWDFAAQRVQDEYPNNVRIGELTRMLQRSPVGGPFIGYQSEAIRAYGNSLANIAADLKAGDRSGPARKIAGNIAVWSMLPAIGAATKEMFGVSDDKEKALDAGRPSWERGKSRAYLGGKTLVDTSYLNPYPFIVSGNELMSGRPFKDVAIDYLKSFLGGSIPLQNAMEWYRNESGTGARLYPEKISDTEWWAGLLKHAGLDPVIPKGLGEVQRTAAAFTGEEFRGQKVKPGRQALRLATGLTPNDSDPPKALAKLVREYSTGWSSLYNDKMRDKSADKNAVLREINARRKEKYDEIRSLFKAMKSSGSSTKDINAALKDYGLSAKSIEQFEKNYVAYAPGRLR